MYWEITYKYTKDSFGNNFFYVEANTEKGAIGMFRHIKGDSFYIVEVKTTCENIANIINRKK